MLWAVPLPGILYHCSLLWALLTTLDIPTGRRRQCSPTRLYQVGSDSFSHKLISARLNQTLLRRTAFPLTALPAQESWGPCCPTAPQRRCGRGLPPAEAVGEQLPEAGGGAGAAGLRWRARGVSAQQVSAAWESTQGAGIAVAAGACAGWPGKQPRLGAPDLLAAAQTEAKALPERRQTAPGILRAAPAATTEHLPALATPQRRAPQEARAPRAAKPRARRLRRRQL